ncbi:MAG: indole-3-glycerol phosphate synthase TrpC [Armatimonadetes bacterium]|nr:indole-3-glycerol phosphate synthase TrpC [Armatimonadota bacterium]
MILDQIVAATRLRVEALKQQTDVQDLEKQLGEAMPPRPFAASLKHSDRLGLIAEIKKASPSKGVIAPDFDAALQAAIYRDALADCLSVLTEPQWFQGDLEHLRAAREVSRKPVLRKDFIIDEIQIVEARLAGADCILLIVSVLKDWEVRQLKAAAHRLGMDALVEVHDETDLKRALFNGSDFIGINNRDLQTFEVDLGTTERLRKLIPSGCTVVAESGVFRHEDARRLREAGADALLVGESLMRSGDAAGAIEALLQG